MYKILNQQFTYIDLYAIVPLFFNAFPYLIYISWMYIINLLCIICSFDFLKNCSPNVRAPSSVT